MQQPNRAPCGAPERYRYNAAGVGITQQAMWGRSSTRPGLWAIVPRDGGPLYFAADDGHGNLQAVA